MIKKYLWAWVAVLLVVCVSFSTSDLGFLDLPSDFVYFHTEMQGDGFTHYVLSHNIVWEEDTYKELYDKLDNAKEGSVIFIDIDYNYGGYVKTMLHIIEKIKNSKAFVVVTVKGLAASAAANILMQGDRVIIPNKSQILWHTGSVTYGGFTFRVKPWLGPIYTYTLSMLDFLYHSNVKYVAPNTWFDLSEIVIYVPVPVDRLHYTWESYRFVNPYNKHRNYISREYWDFIKTGEDRFISGKQLCDWNLNDRLDKSTAEYYTDNGCTLRGVKSYELHK